MSAYLATSVLRRALVAIGLTAGLALAPCLAAAAEPARQSESLTVTGAVKKSIILGIDDLKAFPADQIATVTLARTGEDKAGSTTLRGVRLTAVLDRAGLAGTDRNDSKHTIVLATATDSDVVAFSWPELFDTVVGPGVLVVFARDGQALGEAEGRIALVSGNDLHPGPRNVKWLERIDVRIVK